jgi:hypothetical protein
MAIYPKSKSLNAQINEAERQIADRQRKVDACTAVLVEKVQQQVQKELVVTPATLLLAGCIGFIFAELSQCPAQKNRSSNHHGGASEPSPLKIALDLITSARTLYTALPLVWLMTSRYQQPITTKAPKQ